MVGRTSCTTWGRSSWVSDALSALATKEHKREQGTPSLAGFEQIQSPLLVYPFLIEMARVVDARQDVKWGQSLMCGREMGHKAHVSLCWLC